MAAVFADLQSVFEFALEQMGLATVAFNEDIFSLYDAFFRRNRFYALCFLAEPSHKNGGKRSTSHKEAQNWNDKRHKPSDAKRHKKKTLRGSWEASFFLWLLCLLWLLFAAKTRSPAGREF